MAQGGKVTEEWNGMADEWMDRYRQILMLEGYLFSKISSLLSSDFFVSGRRSFEKTIAAGADIRDADIN